MNWWKKLFYKFDPYKFGVDEIDNAEAWIDWNFGRIQYPKIFDCGNRAGIMCAAIRLNGGEASPQTVKLASGGDHTRVCYLWGGRAGTTLNVKNDLVVWPKDG